MLCPLPAGPSAWCRLRWSTAASPRFERPAFVDLLQQLPGSSIGWYWLAREQSGSRHAALHNQPAQVTCRIQLLILHPWPLYSKLQRFSVLGSTGSIGTQTLDIMAEFPDKFKLVALAAGSNVKLLAEQVPEGGMSSRGWVGVRVCAKRFGCGGAREAMGT